MVGSDWSTYAELTLISFLYLSFFGKVSVILTMGRKKSKSGKARGKPKLKEAASEKQEESKQHEVVDKRAVDSQKPRDGGRGSSGKPRSRSKREENRELPDEVSQPKRTPSLTQRSGHNISGGGWRISSRAKRDQSRRPGRTWSRARSRSRSYGSRTRYTG